MYIISSSSKFVPSNMCNAQNRFCMLIPHVFLGLALTYSFGAFVICSYDCFILITKFFSSKRYCILLKLQKQLLQFWNGKSTLSLKASHNCWSSVPPVHNNAFPKISKLLPFISTWYPLYNFSKSLIIVSSISWMWYVFKNLALTIASSLIVQVLEQNLGFRF